VPDDSAQLEAISNPFPLTFKQRLLLPIISWAAVVAVRLLGCTLRYDMSSEEVDPQDGNLKPAIWAFWHRCLLPTAYRFRNREIGVLTSQSFDGEVISRTIEKLGFKAIRGSSTRGGAAAVRNAQREIEAGGAVAFTVDGPRGPRFVTKPGPILLAMLSDAPVFAFHVAVERAWTLRTWDRMIIPKPFSRVLVRAAAPIRTHSHLSDTEIREYVAELQSALDRVREFAEAEVKK
jgi:lysophospholipid acyltransferase (LPLAT)-like uncharacterized protein